MVSLITSWESSSNFATADISSPLIVLLHGYGSNERDLSGIAQWLHTELPWVSLRAPFELDHGGFAWFPVTTPLNPSADDVEAGTNAIWEWIDATAGTNRPIIAIGFSQGGLMASQLLRTRPKRLTKTAILAGFTGAAPQPGDDALREGRPEVLWARGDADHVITDDAIQRTAAFLNAHSTLVERTYSGLGHSVDRRVLADLRDYLTSAS